LIFFVTLRLLRLILRHSCDFDLLLQFHEQSVFVPA
jgi:hypothetical protein